VLIFSHCIWVEQEAATSLRISTKTIYIFPVYIDDDFIYFEKGLKRCSLGYLLGGRDFFSQHFLVILIGPVGQGVGTNKDALLV
jgi:hypothetical protein